MTSLGPSRAPEGARAQPAAAGEAADRGRLEQLVARHPAMGWRYLRLMGADPDEAGQVRVADFGLARVAFDDDLEGDEEAASRRVARKRAARTRPRRRQVASAVEGEEEGQQLLLPQDDGGVAEKLVVAVAEGAGFVWALAGLLTGVV